MFRPVTVNVKPQSRTVNPRIIKLQRAFANEARNQNETKTQNEGRQQSTELSQQRNVHPAMRRAGRFRTVADDLDEMFGRMWGDMDSVFPSDLFSLRNSLIRDLDRKLLRSVPSSPKFDWNPRADLSQTNEAYIVKAELPGVSKDDVKIEVDEETLIIKGEKKQEHETKEHKYYQKETSYGTFLRTFPLPEGTDSKAIKASFKDGILKVTIPKKEASAQTTSIPIEAS